MKVKVIGVLMGAILAIGTGADAVQIKEKVQQPTVEHSADRTITTEMGAINSRVYYAPGKQRDEMTFQGVKNITIIRTDKGLVWTIMPQQKMYSEMKLEKAKEKSQDITDCPSCNVVDWKPAGNEVVSGITATKYKFSTFCPKHGNTSGNMWFSKEWIMIKMEAVVATREGKSQIKLELANLKIGKQDPSLFEIPKGYQKAGMNDGISEMMKEAEKTQGEKQGSVDKKQADLLKEGRAFKLTDWEKAKVIDELDLPNFSSGYWKMQKEYVNETIIFGKTQGNGGKDEGEGFKNSTEDLWGSSLMISPPQGAEGVVIKRIGDKIIWRYSPLPDGSLKEEGEILCNGNTLKAIRVIKQTMNGRPLSMNCEKTQGTRLGGRDYTTTPRKGRDYTSKPRGGYDYTAQPREDKPTDTLKKGLKGLLGR